MVHKHLVSSDSCIECLGVLVGIESIGLTDLVRYKTKHELHLRVPWVNSQLNFIQIIIYQIIVSRPKEC